MIPWFELWDAEPGLRPEGLFRPTEVARKRWELWIEPGRAVSIEIPDTAASALCFAAAVKWLATFVASSKGDFRLVAPGVYDSPKWAVEMLSIDNPATVWFGDTPEAAAFSACKALIAARQATPPGSPVGVAAPL